MIWSSLALDIGSLTFIFLGFYTMTAAMVAISNHWDACYDTTADVSLDVMRTIPSCTTPIIMFTQYLRARFKMYISLTIELSRLIQTNTNI